VELWKFGTHERASRLTPLMLFSVAQGDGVAIRFSTPRRQGAVAGYSVTAGKTLILTRVVYRIPTAASSWSFGYTDSDRGFANAADGANPVELDDATPSGRGAFAALTAQTVYDFSCYYEIPAGKFPRIVHPASGQIFAHMFFGHEV